jgi:hypothetical protein
MAEVFVPLNRFQSVVTNLTGEEDEIYVTPTGVSSIVLSCQVTNNSLMTQPVTMLVTSNRELPIPSFEGVYSGSGFISASAGPFAINGIEVLDRFSGSFDSSSVLLSLNRQFIRKEAAAYVSFQNNLSETPFVFTSSRFEGYALDLVDAIAYDIANNKKIRTDKAAKAYFSKNGVNTIKEIYTEEYSSSLDTIEYVNYLSQQIIKNQSVTGSQFVSRLYQTTVTQSFNSFTPTNLEFSSSAYVINNLTNIVLNTIENPSLVAQNPIQLVTNVTIPSADSLSPVVSGKLVLEEGYGFIVSGSTDLTVILSLLESANE